MEELQNEEIIVETEEEKKWCVYMHTCKHNNKVYVGITSQRINKRWQNGLGYLNKNKDGTYKQPLMARAVLKYSDWDNDWEHTIFAENLSNNEARTMERILVALYDTQNPNNGYNICSGGEISPMYGRHHSQETIEKMKSNRVYLSGENAPHYGKPHSEEAKIKMSQARMGIPNKSVRVKVCQYTKQGEFVNEYEYVDMASKQTGISRSAIENCLCGLSRTAGGYIWKRSNEELTDEEILMANSRKNKQIKPLQTELWFNKKQSNYKVRFKKDGKYVCTKTYLTKEDAEMAIYNYKNNKESWYI